MASKLPKATLNLKQFLLRREVLNLYRDIHRTLRKVSDKKTRNELREWARTDFRNNMHHTDETSIKSEKDRLISAGKGNMDDVTQQN